MLEFVEGVREVVGIRLGVDSALVRFLDVVFIALLLREADRVLFGPEVHVGALHGVRRRLPSHQGVLPAMALREHVPIHPPVVGMPGAGLGGGLRLAVDSTNSVKMVSIDLIHPPESRT